MSRLTILSDPKYAELQPHLMSRMRAASAQLNAENLASLLDHTVLQELAEGFARAGAHEGTIWLLEGDSLVAAYNNGPYADKLIGYRQPLSAGLISLVYALEQPLCENQVYVNAQQDPSLDNRLSVKTWAMIATPFYLAREVRGVISCVQLVTRDESGEWRADPPGFEPEVLQAIAQTAAVISQLLDFRFLSAITSWAPGGLV